MFWPLPLTAKTLDLIYANISMLSSYYKSILQTTFDYKLLFALKHLKGKHKGMNKPIGQQLMDTIIHVCNCSLITLSNRYVRIINNDKLLTGKATNQPHKGQWAVIRSHCCLMSIILRHITNNYQVGDAFA